MVELPIPHQHGHTDNPKTPQGRFPHSFFNKPRDGHNLVIYKHTHQWHKSVCKHNALFHLYGFLWGNHLSLWRCNRLGWIVFITNFIIFMYSELNLEMQLFLNFSQYRKKSFMKKHCRPFCKSPNCKYTENVIWQNYFGQYFMKFLL